LSPIALRATYRLQLTPAFGFAAARALVPYLRELGVSHLYLSPSLQARHGSPHGYDVVDPTRVSADLGGETELRALAGAAHQAGLGIVLDLVPNHMAVDDANPFWRDGELRRRFFDIDPVTGRHRRFFDVDDLAGVRQEDPEVFARTHALALSLLREGVVDALRIDHPDGLADPAGYFERLSEGGARTVWIEKILKPAERLRDWPITGTVGYEFLNEACSLFIDGDAEATLTDLWHELSGDARGFAEVALEAKLELATTSFAPEIERLASDHGDGAELDAGALARAVASFPVYRTYVEPASGAVDDQDRAAVAEAQLDPRLARELLLEAPAPAPFVIRFQQTTPAVFGKGVEDTAFYRYGRLLALCEVGGDPSRFGISVGALHEANLARARRFPEGMLTTATHDTKRSSDVRARIAALTWMPGEWERRTRRWLELTQELRSGGAPDDRERYFLFQTLAGTWPIELERIQHYMVKAIREAKHNTSWMDPRPEWESAVTSFCAALYEHRPFLEDFEPFAGELADAGERIALGTRALKLTSPGVPDIYQGDELELRTLVDPDNRRPVDWQRRREMLTRVTATSAAPGEGDAGGGRELRKLWLTTRLLHLRRRRPDAFAGDYRPVAAGQRTVAYLRADQVLTVIDTRPGVPHGALPELDGVWRDVLCGTERSLRPGVLLAELLDRFGIAVLERI
jgi:(1->4)-alpha-D-glucan 1-alpha-D-glucosylmutase